MEILGLTSSSLNRRREGVVTIDVVNILYVCLGVRRRKECITDDLVDVQLNLAS